MLWLLATFSTAGIGIAIKSGPAHPAFVWSIVGSVVLAVLFVLTFRVGPRVTLDLTAKRLRLPDREVTSDAIVAVTLGRVRREGRYSDGTRFPYFDYPIHLAVAENDAADVRRSLESACPGKSGYREAQAQGSDTSPRRTIAPYLVTPSEGTGGVVRSHDLAQEIAAQARVFFVDPFSQSVPIRHPDELGRPLVELLRARRSDIPIPTEPPPESAKPRQVHSAWVARYPSGPRSCTVEG